MQNSEDLFSVEPLAPTATTTILTRSLSEDAAGEPNSNINLGLNYGVLQVEDNNDLEGKIMFIRISLSKLAYIQNRILASK